MVYNFNFEDNYDDNIFLCGIYKIYYEDTPTKVYIGSALKSLTTKYKKTSGFWYRFRNHTGKLLKNNHHSAKLQSAFNKYGKENFKFEIVETCDGANCIEREQYWINYYNSYYTGYNCAPLANTMKGFNHSDKTKNQISISKKNWRNSYLQDILKYREQKKSFKEIAKLLDINYHTVSKIFKENGYSVDKMLSRKIKIYQYDIKDGFLVKEWQSISDCMYATGIHTSKIVSNLKKKTLTHKGFHFSYVELSAEEVFEGIKRRKNK